jgi:hypothetical protein
LASAKEALTRLRPGQNLWNKNINFKIDGKVTGGGDSMRYITNFIIFNDQWNRPRDQERL